MQINQAMNKKIYLFLISLLLAFSARVEASHLYGGEVTWTCLGSGQFQFQLKVYRDCNGCSIANCPLPTALDVYGHPTVCSIPFNAALTTVTDISPSNCPANCTTGGPGTTQEYVLRTNPITLPGVPPATGWTFAINSFARNTLVNLSGGGQGFTLRSTMFPYVGQNTNPCYDNSPYFAERPNTFICIGYQYTYNPTAVDADRDSLVYSWATCLDAPTSSNCSPFVAPVIPFSPGPYTITNQLPGGVTLDSQSGEISFFVPQSAATIGNFATCIKVTAYRCNQKIAEVYRDIGVTLTAGCIVQGVAPNNINLPPTLTKPFAAGTSYDTIVYVGDTVRFQLQATDFQKNIGAGNIGQTITLTAAGDQLGIPTNSSGGCGNPPCAKLDKALPVTSPFANFVNFEWVTACNHVVPPVGCLGVNDTYYFIIKALDNYCPAPGISTATIKIKVKIPPKLKAPRPRGASVLNAAGDVALYWDRPIWHDVLDTHNVFHSYEVFASTSNGGPYTLIDSVWGNKKFYKQKGDTLTAAQLSLIGANALTAPVYFYIKTRSVCDGDSISDPSDTIRTMDINYSIVNCETKLTWNSLFTHAYPLGSADTVYTIYREHPFGSIPVAIGTVPATWPTATFTDPYSKNVCRDSVKYMVTIGDTLVIDTLPTVRCLSKSNKDSVYTDNRFNATISPTGPTDICPGNCVAMSATPSPTKPCFTYTYTWSNGATTQNINACNAGGYSATILQSPSGCTATTPVSVVNLKTIPTATMSLQGNASVCPGDSVDLKIIFTGTGPWIYSYNAPGSGGVGTQVINGPVGGTLTNPLIIRIPPPVSFNYTMNSVFAVCTGNVAGNANVTVRVKPTATMAVTTNDTICVGSASSIQIAFTGTAPWEYTYTSTTGPSVSGGPMSINPLTIPVSPTATTTYGISYVKDACVGTFSGTRKVVVIPTASAALSVTGSNPICTGSGTTILVTFTGGGGFGNYTCSLKDNTTGLLTPISTSAGSVSIPVSPLVTTTYSLQGFTNSTKNCPGTMGGTVTVTVNAAPTANLSAITNSSICKGDSVQLQVAFTGSGPYNFGLVTNSGAAVNTVAGAANPYTFYVKPIANANYILTSVSNTFCGNNNIHDTVPVTVYQLPTAVLSGTNTICAGQQTPLTINFTGTGPFTGSYTATPGGTTNFNVPVSPYVANVGPALTTTYALSTTVNDAHCANTSNAAITTVTVNQLPTAAISGNKTICQGTNDTLLVTFTTGTAPWKFYYKNTLGVFTPITTSANPYKLVVNPASTTTYSLDSVFSGVCKGSVFGSGVVTVQPLPTAIITTADDTICNGAATNLSIQFTGVAPFKYKLAGQAALQNAATNPVSIPVSPTTNTTYTLQVINDNLCTSNVSQPVSIKVIQLPTAVISTATPNLCNGSAGSITINFTGTGPFSTTYSYGSTNTPVNSATASTTIPVSPTGTTTYSLNGVVTGLFGCSAPVNVATALITVRQLPTVSLTGNPTICSGDTTNITFSFTGNPPYNYSYFNGVSNVALTTSSSPVQVPVHPSITTAYTPISVTDAYCTGTNINGSASVTVNPIPTVDLQGSDTICFGGATSLDLYFTGNAPYDYTYMTNGVTAGPFTANTDSVNIPITPSLNTRYTMGIILQDRYCTNNNVKDSVYVKVTPTPSAAISGTTAICAGSSTNLQLNFTGEAPYTYSYNAASILVGPLTTNASSVNLSVTPTLTTNYTLTANVIGNSCSGSTSGNALITVNAIPNAVITTSTDTLCHGDSTQLHIQFTGAAPYQYQLQGGSMLNANSNPYSFYVVPANGLVNYTLTNINDANCPATINQAVSVRVLPNPTVVITTATPDICTGAAGNLTFTFTGVAPFNATYTVGASSFPVTSNTASTSVVVNPTQPTTYNLAGNVTGLYGCKATATGSANIMVRALPTATISGTPVICRNDIAPITLTFTGTPPFNYTYLNNVTNQSITGSTSLNPLTLNLSPAATSNYTVTNVHDNYCLGTQLNGNAVITVNQLPSPVITGDDKICKGESSVLSTTIPYSGYVWSNTQTSSTISATTSGNYSVSVTDANGCKKASPLFALLVNEVPTVDFTNDTSKTCEIPNIHFTNLSTYDAGSTFAWSLGDNATSAEQNPSHIYTQPGNYPIELIVTTPAGCADTVDRNVDIIFYPLPVAAFKADPQTTNIFSGPISFTDLSQNAVKWTWLFSDLDSSSEKNTSYTFPDIGEYVVKLIVENISGCVSETHQEVVVNPFYLPSGFTPNGDGKNEVFFNPGFTMDYTGFNLRIFNKWGQMFYQADTYTNPWDGSDGKGKPAPQGVYVYSLSITNKSGKQHQYNGTITLLR